jgi:hypothetical protein
VGSVSRATTVFIVLAAVRLAVFIVLATVRIAVVPRTTTLALLRSNAIK